MPILFKSIDSYKKIDFFTPQLFYKLYPKLLDKLLIIVILGINSFVSFCTEESPIFCAYAIQFLIIKKLIKLNKTLYRKVIINDYTDIWVLEQSKDR